MRTGIRAQSIRTGNLQSFILHHDFLAGKGSQRFQLSLRFAVAADTVAVGGGIGRHVTVVALIAGQFLLLENRKQLRIDRIAVFRRFLRRTFRTATDRLRVQLDFVRRFLIRRRRCGNRFGFRALFADDLDVFEEVALFRLVAFGQLRTDFPIVGFRIAIETGFRIEIGIF